MPSSRCVRSMMGSASANPIEGYGRNHRPLRPIRRSVDQPGPLRALAALTFALSLAALGRAEHPVQSPQAALQGHGPRPAPHAAPRPPPDPSASDVAAAGPAAVTEAAA